MNGIAVNARPLGGSVFEIPLESSNQYNVHVEAEGFREQSVWVDPADSRAVRVTLQTAPTGLSIVSQTIGGKIWLNDRGPYDSPTNFRDLAPGRYAVRIEKDGFNHFSQQVDVVAGEVRTIGPITLTLNDAPWPGAVPEKRPYTPSPGPAPYVGTPGPSRNGPSTVAADNGSQVRNDIVPKDADEAGSIPLKTTMRTDQIVNSIRSVAQRRGWAVTRVENNVVVLTLKHHGYDATLYCRFDAHHIEFLSDSYKSGLIGNSAAKQVPTSWIKNVQQDLTKLMGGK